MFKLYKDYKKYKRIADKVYKVAGLIATYRYVINTVIYKRGYLPTSLSNSFDWSNTLEGWEYWNNIDNKVWSLK